MNALKTGLLALALGMIVCQASNAQDYIGYVESLAADAGRRAQMHARNAVDSYRQQTGDYSTPDQQVFDYLTALSQQQNPGFYADLQRRENAFQQQQRQYVQNSNAILDNSFNNYMDRSRRQHSSHRQYVREGIWERSLYSDPNTGSVYELPYYEPGVIYQSNDGSMYIQDEYGQYHQWNGY